MFICSVLDALIFSKTPLLLKSVYPNCIWKVNNSERKIYLTFDDGPTPVVTDFVLSELKKWNALATFFCIGKNIEAHGDIFDRIIDDGHSIGNHTYNHLNGWKHKTQVYVDNIDKCAKAINERTALGNSKLFRPPYGKLTPIQYKTVNHSYTIVMWDVLSFDFDLSQTNEDVLDRVIKNSESGSIIVFHDSIKAQKKIEYTLPKVLEHFTDKGFMFDKL